MATPKETFQFPNHTQSTAYPESGNRMQLGNSYVFAAPSPAPDQRTFTLNFESMAYFLDGDGKVSELIDPEKNLYALELFYQRHRLHKTFIYPHPVHGELAVKFNKPLQVPQGRKGGGGWVESFSVELVEQP
ncbi:hypothetical protein [Cupriavidus sp. RAF12]|uniref:hypothetical protein n=1 Tax=Cupriavidus sp. RAF12 TaxID=3233050 RepID=UPI003F8E3031